MFLTSYNAFNSMVLKVDSGDKNSLERMNIRKMGKGYIGRPEKGIG